MHFLCSHHRQIVDDLGRSANEAIHRVAAVATEAVATEAVATEAVATEAVWLRGERSDKEVVDEKTDSILKGERCERPVPRRRIVH